MIKLEGQEGKRKQGAPRDNLIQNNSEKVLDAGDTE